jgi:DDE superfamily endonuclease
MAVQEGIMEQPNIVGRWSEALKALHGRIAHRFARSEARERIRRYLLGQLGRVERKNGRQLAKAIGEADPQGVQRLLNSAKWDATLVRDDLREYVVEHLGNEESGVLIREHHRTCPRVRGGGGADGTPQAPAALLIIGAEPVTDFPEKMY